MHVNKNICEIVFSFIPPDTLRRTRRKRSTSPPPPPGGEGWPRRRRDQTGRPTLILFLFLYGIWEIEIIGFVPPARLLRLPA